MLRVGIIGAGRVTETRHLPILQSLPGVTVSAISERDDGRLTAIAERFRIPHRYTDERRLLRDPDIDIVALCAPTQFHAEIALAALEAKKHLFIEKPLALTIDECDQLVARAQHSSRKVMVGFNLRWHPYIRQTRTLLQQQRLGSLEMLRTAFSSGIRRRPDIPDWRKRRMLGGGGLVELAVHHFDLWRFLSQSDIDEVYVASRSAAWDDETLAISARMANGLLVSTCIMQNSVDVCEIEVYGQQGHLRCSCYRLAGIELTRVESQASVFRAFSRHMLQRGKQLPSALLLAWKGGPYFAAYRAQWRNFIDCITHDRPVSTTLEEGRYALQVTMAATASASSGHPMKVQDAPRFLTPVVRAGVKKE